MHPHCRSFLLVMLALAGACSSDVSCRAGSTERNGACIEDDDAGGLDTDDDPVEERDGGAGDCHPDADQDGHADRSKAVSCEADMAALVPADDCDDDDETSYPGAKEICDGADNNCDGKLDEGFDHETFYPDVDKDGHGGKAGVQACMAPKGHVDTSDDCDDADNTVYAGAIELCDGKDNDCNAAVDDAVMDRTFFLDADGDGHGNPGTGVVDCKPPAKNYVFVGDDCDDACATCAPGNEEALCDGKDDNCADGVDEGLLNACGMCGGNSSEVCDGQDNDCDGTKDDGFFCSVGESVVCQTSCGSNGSGECTDECRVPGKDACTPPPEVCNGLDDNCDGAKDEIFACALGTLARCTTSCGTTGSGACTESCSVPSGAACNPPAESCNGTDDNCNGEQDEIFDCVKGAPSVACKTSCGSTGRGVCTSTCELPVGDACTPPGEVCNYVDDDCDGKVDPKLINKVAGGEVAYSQTPAAGITFNAAQVALLERSTGGSWLLYRGFDTNQFTKSGTLLSYVSLDATGKRTASGTLPKTDSSTIFFADSDGKWAVVLSRTQDSKNDSRSLRLQLFKAASMAYVGETKLVTYDDDDATKDNNDANDCNDVYPLDVSVFEDAEGDVHIGSLYKTLPGALSGSTCGNSANQKTYIRVAKYSATGEWTVPAAPPQLVNVGLSPFEAKIERSPCRNEWLLLYRNNASGNATWRSRRVNTTPTILLGDLDTIEDATFVNLHHGASTSCDTDPTVLLSYGKNVAGTNVTYVRRWRVDRNTGAVAPIGAAPLKMPTGSALETSAREVGGRWLAVTWLFAGSTAVPQGFEIFFDAPAGQEFRSIPLFSQSGGANPGAIGLVGLYVGGASALVDGGSGVMIALPNQFSSDSNLTDYQPISDIGTPSAITYKIGCN